MATTTQAVQYFRYGGGAAGLEEKNLRSHSLQIVAESRRSCLQTVYHSGNLESSPWRLQCKLFSYFRYGGGAAGLEHVVVPIPTPRKGEILIKIEAASINPVDWKIQQGLLKPFFPYKFPFTPVSDIAGKVASIGPNVEGFKEGDNVVTSLSARNSGGLAEYATAPSNMTVKYPTEIPAAEVSGLGVAGLTALKSLEIVGAKFDGTGNPANILITAASGGVGHYAVQLAKLANFHVTATCGARNIELVKSLGADEVLDYKTPQGETLESPSGKKYDGIIHCGSSLPWSKFDPILSNNGMVIDVTPKVSSIFTFSLKKLLFPKKLLFSKKRLQPFLMIPKLEDLQIMVNLLKDGKIKTLIDSRFPLARAEDAWSKSMEGHATGKVVVEMISQQEK